MKILDLVNVGKQLTWKEKYDKKTIQFWGILGVGYPEGDTPVWAIFLREFQVEGGPKTAAVQGVTVPRSVWHIKEERAEIDAKTFDIQICPSLILLQ